MGWFPKAKRVPTPYGRRVPRNDQDRGILHVAVSNARSLPPWNENTWHMYVAKDGSCEQYVDSIFRAFASADANDDAFSIETAGGVGSAAQVNAEPWTPQQVQTLAEIMIWRKREDGTPLDVLPDSKPGRRGWGPHRLGIDPWRVPGGERWTAHPGKLCPGDAKVAQIPTIVALARRLDAGGDDMPTVKELLDAEVSKETGSVRQTLEDARQIARRAEDQAQKANAGIAALRAEMNAKLDAILAKLGT